MALQILQAEASGAWYGLQEESTISECQISVDEDVKF